MVAGYCSWCRVESCGVSPFAEGYLISAARWQAEEPCTHGGAGGRMLQPQVDSTMTPVQHHKVQQNVTSVLNRSERSC